MLHKTGPKRYSFYTHDFLFYVLVVISLFFVSCFCNSVRPDLIPQRNLTLENLPESDKSRYVELMQMIDDDEKGRLEKIFGNVTNPDKLAESINLYLKLYKAYQALRQLLSKSEQDVLQQQFDQAPDLDAKEKLIEQYGSPLQTIKNAAPQTKQNYRDLLEILPDKEAIKFKNAVVGCGTCDAIDQLIASKLPGKLKQLSDDDKENLAHLSDTKRQEVFKGLMNGSVDVNTLIEQKIQEQQDQDEVPQDGWGNKLPLKDEKRKQFFMLINTLPSEDQKALKELFNKVEEDSVRNLVIVYELRFNKEEKMRLLDTMSYLYKGWPRDTIAMCNDTASMSVWKKMQLFRRTTGGQLRILQKLDEFLSELIEDPDKFKAKYIKAPNEPIEKLIDELID